MDATVSPRVCWGSIVLADMANAPCLWQESISDSVEDAPMVSWYTAL